MPALIDPPKAVRVRIPGRFWDAQLYSGKLWLFGISGELFTISWKEVVQKLPVPRELRIAAEFALLGNHHLYEQGAHRLLGDPQIRELLLRKFRALGEYSPWEAKLQANVENNPLPFPHSDSEAHYNTLYVAVSEGLFGGPIGAAEGRTVRLSEVPTLNIAAKYATIAQAAGSEGLFAVRMESDRATPNRTTSGRLTQVSSLECFSCEWGTSSIVAVGNDNNVYVAPYESISDRGQKTIRGRPEREFQSIISQSDIFGSESVMPQGFSWGAGDKIFRIENGRIRVIQQRRRKKERSFPIKGRLRSKIQR